MANYFEYGFKSTEASHTHNYLVPNILEILSINNSKSILDIGCGNGSMAINLIEKGFNVYGIDASEKGIGIAKNSFPDRFYLHNIQDIELPSELSEKSFDTIISTEVIEHLFDPRSYIKLCKNILIKNKQGILILSTPYHGFLKNMVLSILNKWDNHLNPLWDGGHIKFWSKKTLTKLFEELGFTNINFYGCGRIPFLWKSMIITGKINSNE